MLPPFVAVCAGSQNSNLIKDNSFDTFIDLSSYTSTKYKTLHDGYAGLVNTTGTTRLYVTDSNNNGVAIDASQAYNAIFIKKGLYLQIGTLSGTLTLARFFSLK